MIAAGESAPFEHAPDDPSLRSKRGVEHFRRIDGTHSRAIRRRGAPTWPTGAAITPDVLNKGLRQCQFRKHKPCNNRLNRGCRHVPAGTSYRSPPDVPGGWGVNRDKRYRNGTRSREFCSMASACEYTATVGVSACRALRDMRAVPIHSTAAHMLLAKTHHSAAATNSAMSMHRRSARAAKRGPRALVRSPATRCCCFLSRAEKRSVPI